MANANVSEQEVNKEFVCRICHSTATIGNLISPCDCKGSMALVHQICIEMWLGQSNATRCEICYVPFDVIRIRKSFWDWLKQPDTVSDRRYLFADLGCFFLLLPLSAISAWLCIMGAKQYLAIGKTHEFEALGLIIITLFLLFVFFSWIFIAARHHYTVWRDWSNTHYNVRIMNLKSTSENHSPSDAITLLSPWATSQIDEPRPSVDDHITNS